MTAVTQFARNVVANTTMGAVSSNTTGTVVAIAQRVPDSSSTKASIYSYAVSVVAATVTNGAIFCVDVQNANGNWDVVVQAIISTTGSYAFALPSLDGVKAVRHRITDRQDGTFTAALSKTTL